MRRAVFLDRDGVINAMIATPDGLDSPRSVEQFQLLPGAARAIRSLNDLNYPVVVVSNQPGIAKGKFGPDDLHAITEYMTAALRAESGTVDGLYYCLHHPQAVAPEYRVACDCRKPKAGLLKRAAAELDLALAGSYMVGDQLRDMSAGKSVGCTTLLVTPGAPDQRPAEADYVCHDLQAAALLIAQLERSSVAVH